MTTKVYTLLITYPYESSEILGVYSNRDLAEIQKTNAEGIDCSNGYNEFDVEEFELIGDNND